MKRGEMAIGMIIAIVVGIIILTFSIYAIVTNKGTFHDKIENSVGGSTLDDLLMICNSESGMDQYSSFCCNKKVLKTEELNQEITCSELANMEISNNKILELNCEEFTC